MVIVSGDVCEVFRTMIDTVFASQKAFEQCEAFRNTRFDLDGRMLSANELCGILWNCADICPAETCVSADLPRDFTYGQAARSVSHFFALKAVA
jgi:hypothetical protein